MNKFILVVLAVLMPCVVNAQHEGRYINQVSGSGSNLTLTGTTTQSGTGVLLISNASDITLSGSATSDSGGGDINFPSSDQPRYGVWWGGESYNTGIAADRHDSGQDKLRIMSRNHVDILPGQSGLVASFVQLHNDAFDNGYTFLSTEGGAEAARVNVPSHKLGFNTEWWDGDSAELRVSWLRATTDAVGKSYLSVYPNGDTTVDTYPFSWPPRSPGTETVRLAVEGVSVVSGSAIQPSLYFLSGTNTGLYYTGSGIGVSVTGTNVGTWSSAGLTNAGEFVAPANNANPSYSFAGATTSGLGCFGADWQLVRSAATQMFGDGSGVNVSATLLAGGVIRGADGTVAAPEYSFSSDTNTGIWRIGVDNLGIVTGGTNQIVVANTGISVTGTANIAGAITTAADMTFSDVSEGPVIKSPDGNRWRIAVDNAGALSTVDLDP